MRMFRLMSQQWWAAGVLLLMMVIPSTGTAQVPQISQLVPSSAPPGSIPPASPGLAVRVSGTGFISGSVVNWNGSPRTTTFVSSDSLTAVITAEDLESPGTAWVTVHSPGSQASVSNVSFFEITNPTASVSFTKTEYAIGTEPNYVATADLNFDGKLDLVVPNTADGTVGVLLGNGDGTFQPMVSYSTAGIHPAFVAVGDFNGDGIPDLAVPNYYSNNVAVLLGNGDGTFQAAVTSATGAQPYGLAVADLNGDGKLDLAVPNVGNGTVSVLLGIGNGTFQGPVNYTVGATPSSVAGGDFNGDGKLDLAVANEQSEFVTVLLGIGDGTFQAPVNYGGGGVFSLAAADLNGDGKLDLVGAGGTSNSILVRLGNGDGTFQAPSEYPAGIFPYWIGVGDLNGDGRLDVVTANVAYSQSSFNVLLGNGDGTFQPAVSYPAARTNPTGVAVGDFNGDGRMDFAVNNSGTNTLFILLQPTPASGSAQLNGGNTFTGNQTVTGIVTSTSFVGNGSGLTNVTASGLNCAGCVGNAQLGINYALGDSQGGNALNALSLGGNPASFFAPFAGDPNYAPASGGGYVAKTGDTMTGALSLPADGLVAGTNQLVLSGGAVGVGTPSPSARLDLENGNAVINGSGPITAADLPNRTLMIGLRPDGISAALGFQASSSLKGSLEYDSFGFGFNTWNNGTWVRDLAIAPGGNVGIGTRTPQALLEVNGTAQFDGLVTFAPGQTFPGAGTGTIMGVTAGSGLSGGGTSGTVTLNNTGVLSITAGSGIASTGGQTPTLSLNTGFADSRYAQLGAANTFTANQIVPNLTATGTLTSSFGNFSGNNAAQIVSVTQFGAGSAIYANAGNNGTGVTANGYDGVFASGIDVGVSGSSTNNFGVSGHSGTGTGVFGEGGSYGVAGASAAGTGMWGNTTGGIGMMGSSIGSGTGVLGRSNTGTAGVFNSTGGGKILSGQSNGTEVYSVANNGNVKTSGSLVATGAVTIGNGTPINQHISIQVNPTFGPLKPGTCTTASFTLTGAADGDTVALGVPNAMMSVSGIPNYTAWVSAANTVTIRACNLDPATNQKVGASGTIRIDLWKH